MGRLPSRLNWWHEQDDPDRDKPTSTVSIKSGAYPFVIAYTEGYQLTIVDATNCVQFRNSPKPYKKVKTTYTVNRTR